MKQDRHKRKMSAIFSADVVGYSRLMDTDEAWTIKNLDENKRIIGELVKEYGGRVIDAIGDNLLAEFNSVINSVECAVKVQQELKKKNDTLVEERRMHFRIGVNLGDVVEEDGRIYGSGVNIASRLEGLAEPGGVCISGRTYDHIKTKLGLGYKYLGEHNVKNIDEPIRIYRLLMDSDNVGKVIGEKKAPSRSSFRVAIAAVIILIIIAAVSIAWNIHSRKTVENETITEQAPVTSDMKEAPKTIAVLPFVNLSSDPEQEYFVDGLSEEIINSLTQIPNLGVTGRTSSFTFKGSNKKTQEIANELGVDHVLEGSVRKSGNSLRITAQLIRAVDDLHIWSETYDREIKDIFEIQEDIANNVADKLKLTLEAFQLLGGTKDVKAYELYLVAKGQYFYGDIDRAVESIDAAIALDPEFALALVLKCVVYGLKAGTLPPDQVRLLVEEINEATQRAIDLAPNLGKAWFNLAGNRGSEGNFIEAEKLYEKGMELTTESIDYFDYGLTGHYWTVGYLEKSKKLLGELRNKDPFHQLVCSSYMLILGYLGDVQGAEEEYKRGKVIFGDDWGFGLPDIFITLVRLASKDVQSINDISEFPPWASILSIVTENIESPEKGLTELHRLYSSDNDITYNELQIMAIGAAYFGDPEFSMDAWGKTTGSGVFSWNPVMKETRRLPQFKKWAREIGLVDYWKEYGWPDFCRPIGDDDFVCD